MHISQQSDDVKAESIRLYGVLQDTVEYKKSIESELSAKNSENDALAAQLQIQV
jgi:hypothetical protein